MTRPFTKAVPKKTREIFEKFADSKWQIYLVGGAVRDLLLDKKNIPDLDFATSAPPEETQKLFSRAFYDNEFGTVRIPQDNQKLLEITTFRSEENYRDFRHPEEVHWGQSIEEDLARRDFTINAMAVGLKDQSDPDSPLVLIDPFGGQKDLDNKLVRCVGKAAERFGEDPLRIMRAIRFATKLNFQLEKATRQALKKSAPLLDKISAERIRDELFKILLLPNSAEAFEMMRRTGAIKQILPELAAGYQMEQKGHHIWGVWKHALLSAQFTPTDDPVVKLAALLHDVGKPASLEEIDGERTFHNHEVIGARIAKEIGQRLKLSKKDQQRLTKLVRWHQFSVSEKQTDSAIKRFIRRVGLKNVPDMLDLRTGDRLGSGAAKTSWRTEEFKERLIEVQKEPFSVKDLKIDGHDVMEQLNIPPGPKVGQILEKIFALVEEGKLTNERKELLGAIERIVAAD